MISIKNSLSELERVHVSLDIAVDCYRSIIEDLAKYPVLPDDDLTAPMRDQLATLANEVRNASPSKLPGYSNAVRGVLHEHGESVTAYVHGLRQERTQTERALQELAALLTQSSDDHDGQIRTTVDNLRVVARSPEGRAVRDVLRTAADAIESSFEQIKKQHQIAITRFHKEMRMLQRRIDETEAEESIDNLTKLFSQAEIQEKIRTSKGGEFLLLVLRVRGVRLAEVQFGPGIAGQLVSAFVGRLRNTLPINAAIGRWAEETFVALVPPTTGAATALVRSLAEQMPGAYSCVENGKTAKPSIEVRVCSIDATAKDTGFQILERLETALLRI